VRAWLWSLEFEDLEDIALLTSVVIRGRNFNFVEHKEIDTLTRQPRVKDASKSAILGVRPSSAQTLENMIGNPRAAVRLC
jgi:hypothetical protein